jgi:hypothetical protein
MDPVISACGVLCSGCAAYRGRERGLDHQRRAAAAWKRIYGNEQKPDALACGGCLSADREVFHTSRRCLARRCCRAKGLTSCAACSIQPCAALERAQAMWDGVPGIAATLTPADRAEYAEPYCGHRERLAALRRRADQ